MYLTEIDGLPHEFTDAEKIDWLTLKGNYQLAKKYHKIVGTKASFNELVDIADKIQKLERVAYKRAFGGKPPTPLRDSLRSNPSGRRARKHRSSINKRRAYLAVSRIINELDAEERSALGKKYRPHAVNRMSNPSERPTIYWYLVHGKYWITATARGNESPSDALLRSYLNGRSARTNIHVTVPEGFTPGEWEHAILNGSEYKPQHTNARSNPKGWTWAHAKARSYAKRKSSTKRR